MAKIKPLKRIKFLWMGQKGMKNTSPMRHPIEAFKSLKRTAKATPKHKKHATRFALGKVVRSRLLEGPELNILFLGIPFIINFAALRHEKAMKDRRERRRVRGMGHQQPIELTLNPDLGHEGPIEEPMDQAPFSDQALRLYQALQNAGMSEEGARMMASGELEGEDLMYALSTEDCLVLAESFKEYLPGGQIPDILQD
jgi:hypothetical protein